MRTLALAAVAAVSLPVLGACAPARHGAAQHASPRALLRWARPDLTAASEVRAVRSGFALYALDSRELQVVGLDAGTGATRWRYPATPSYAVSGIGLHLAADAGTAVFLAPAGHTPRSGAAAIVAVDAVTGRRRWSYTAAVGLRVVSGPDWCAADHRRVCVVTIRPDFSHPQVRVLDAADGRLLHQAGAGDGRALTDVLFDGLFASTNTAITRVGADGRRLWSRSLDQAWGAAGLDLGGGWDIQLDAGRYVGWIGGKPGRDGAQRLGGGAVAAVDAATGRRLWTRPGASTYCGGLVFDAAHPVWCQTSGTLRRDPGGRTSFSSGPVRLAGFEAATGRIRWSWQGGMAPGLVVADSTVIRVTDTTYLVRTGRGPVLVDLDHGVRAVTRDAPSGWCRADQPIRPAITITAAGWSSYAARQVWPCDWRGRALSAPVTTPAFAGARSGDVFAWAGRAGVDAATVR